MSTWGCVAGRRSPARMRSWSRPTRALPPSLTNAVLPLFQEAMAQRGRKPKPVVIKAAAGNPGKRSLATVVPTPRAGEMLCPQAVERNERARAYWTMYLANAAPGHLLPIDAPLLARLCMALAYADEANEKLEAMGLLVKAPN